LSFADKMLVIKGHRIIASGHPEQLYKNPGNAYVANLFEEANDFTVQGEALLLYPHQLKIVAHSSLSAQVQKSYFKGTYWLIEVMIEGQVVYLNHDRDVEPKKMVHLTIA
jgi:iron(III) transport system ATP-binding protein